MHKDKIKIAVVQFKIKLYKPLINIKKAEKFIKHAHKNNVDIIVFPEDFITGPILANLQLADANQKYVKIFSKLALNYNISIIPGSIIEKTHHGYTNTTYFIANTGKIKLRYEKIHLWHPERKHLTPGNKIAIINTQFGKIGLAICWDIAFPELFRAMAQKGVNIVFIPSFWTKQDGGKSLKYNRNSEEIFVNNVLTARAIENNMVIVYSNFADNIKINNYNLTSIGQSQITMPFYGPIVRLDNNLEKMIIKTVDTSILKISESVYKLRHDMRTSPY